MNAATWRRVLIRAPRKAKGGATRLRLLKLVLTPGSNVTVTTDPNAQPVVFRCRACALPLTPRLRLLTDRSALNGQDGEPYLPRGTFTVSEGDFGPAGEFVVHLDDLVEVEYHPDPRRHNGCCGLDGCDGMNRICREGHEVATECSDCWMAHGARLDPAAVFADDAGCELNPSWLTHGGGAVLGLAREIRRKRSFDLLAVLADALEDAGCADAALLRHLRDSGTHKGGCWATDLLLGEE
jgi:hypothetical protein